MEPNNQPGHGWQSPRRFTPAIVLIGIGLLFLLGNLHVFPGVDWIDFWPAILIIVGILKLLDAGETGRYTGGAIMLGIGVLLLARNLNYIPFSLRELWPLILIAIGVSMLVDRVAWPGRFVHGPGSHRQYVSDTDSVINLSAVFSGGKRKVTTDDFQGGLISAVFGGYEIDLRQAKMKQPSATLKVDMVFGGAEIRIPEDWIAVVQGAGVFGGFSDETLHPKATPDTKRLYVKGGAVFGGVVVKN